MPEGYTHVKYAQRGALLGSVEPKNAAAFALGANGPDPLFFYQCWLPGKQRKPDLHPMGNTMHEEKTGAFLQALLKNAKTQSQWDYALGFLCHYGVDSTMHPFVEAMQAEGLPYCIQAGHGYLEIGLDSYLYEKDYGTGAIPAEASTPKLPKGQLLQIGGLLSQCIEEVYGEKISIDALCTSIDHMRLVRRLLSNPGKPILAAISALESIFGKGYIKCHITPAPLNEIEVLNQPWKNPFTGEMEEKGLFARLEEAAVRCGVLLVNADLWKRGYKSWEELTQIIGNNGYVTGLPVE